MSGVRLDKYMCDTKMVLTRSQARMLIKQGDVFVDDKQVLKPGYEVNNNSKVIIKERKLYVSRGAYKLTHAIEKFNLNFSDLIVMDCGASTGGFTQVCLEAGAHKVYALDVGHGQLAKPIADNSKVINQEGINLKYPFELAEKADAFVADLSFISIKLVIDNILANLKEDGFGVLLIKPQFEIGKDHIGKGGIVEDSLGLNCAKELRDWLLEKFKDVSDLIPSSIKGKTGNQEYLVLVKR